MAQDLSDRPGPKPLRAVDGRVPPHDLDAEGAVLSAVLLEPDALGKLLEALKPDHFYSVANRRIFEASIALHERGTPIDIVSVAGALRDGDRLAQVGGSAYLAQLVDCVPSVARVNTYADRILEKARSRQLIATCQQVAAEGYTGAPADALARSMRDGIERLPHPSGGAHGIALVDSAAIFGELEIPDHIVDRLVRRGSLTLIGGYGSSGKTWLLVQLLLAIASGTTWLGRFACKRGVGTLLDHESGLYEVRRRFQLGARGMGIHVPVEGIDVASMPGLYLNRDDAEPRLAALAGERDMIGFDSLRAFCPGSDENDSEMREPLDRLRRIGERTNCALVALVHSKKTGGEDGDERESLRGSSAIFDAADVVLTVTYHKDKPLLVRQTKARHGSAIEPFEVTIRDTALGTGVEILASDCQELPSLKPSARFDKTVGMVEKTIRQHPGSSLRFIREHLPERVRNETVTAAVEHLAKLGRIKNLGTDRRQEWRPSDG